MLFGALWIISVASIVNFYSKFICKMYFLQITRKLQSFLKKSQISKRNKKKAIDITCLLITA